MHGTGMGSYKYQRPKHVERNQSSVHVRERELVQFENGGAREDPTDQETVELRDENAA